MTTVWPMHGKLTKLNRPRILRFFTKNQNFIVKISVTIIVLPFFLITIGNAKELKLAWSDEFNYSGALDSSKWTYLIGFNSGASNAEVAYFTNRLKNVRVEGGSLIIEAHKETYTSGSTVAGYTSGSITTENRKTFKYGRFEIRAKMPYGKGSHVGIWMSGASEELIWPANGEIDIAEYVGRLPNTIHAYNHYLDPTSKTHAIATVGKFTVPAPYNNFHIYAVEWDETQIKYFIDQTQVATFNVNVAGTGADNPFRKEQNFRLTYTLGGWGWDVDDSTLPQKLVIDYVRVYQEPTAISPVNLLLLK